MRLDQILVWLSGTALAGYLAHTFPLAAALAVFAGWFLFASGKAFLLDPLLHVAARLAHFAFAPLVVAARWVGLD